MSNRETHFDPRLKPAYNAFRKVLQEVVNEVHPGFSVTTTEVVLYLDSSAKIDEHLDVRLIHGIDPLTAEDEIGLRTEKWVVGQRLRRKSP